MELLKLGETDVILQDEGNSAGKIIISNSGWGYNFSYFWGGMGGRTLREFFSGINEDYFVRALGPTDSGGLNVKRTFINIRKRIAEELPWYQHMEFQKDLRFQLRMMQRSAENDRDLVYELQNLKNKLCFDDIDVQEIFDYIFDECWNFFEYHEHRQNVFLKRLFKELQEELKKQPKKTEVYETN